MTWIDKDQHANDLELRIRALEEERAWLLDDVARFRGERNALRQELAALKSQQAAHMPVKTYCGDKPNYCKGSDEVK